MHLFLFLLLSIRFSSSKFFLVETAEDKANDPSDDNGSDEPAELNVNFQIFK